MASGILQLQTLGDGAARFEEVVDRLGSKKQANLAFVRAIKHTGRKAFTKVRRASSKQVGLSQKKFTELGAIKEHKPNFNNLAYEISSSGEHLSLKHFNAKQFSFGVKAKPWGRMRRFQGAFINTGEPKSGIPFAEGHVFIRTSGKSFPIKKLFGPAIPKEIVQGESRTAFESEAKGLNDRLAHEVGRLTKGAVT